MVVTVRLRIEMTPEQVKAYANEYGLDTANVRSDIKRYIENNIQCSPGLEVGVFTTSVAAS